MKKKLLSVGLVILSILTVDAETVSKTVQVNTPGTLHSLLAETDFSTVTDLTLTGTIDARDIYMVNDSMYLLESLDMSAVTIAEYTQTYSEMSSRTKAFAEKKSGKSSLSALSGCSSAKLKEMVNQDADMAVSQQSKVPAEIIVHPANTIPESGFYGNSSLTEIVLPNNLTAIGDYAFCYTEFTTIVLPNTLESIGSSSFETSSLATVHLPASLKEISSSSFLCMYSNTGFTVDASNAYFSCLDGVLYSKDNTRLINYPIGKSSASLTISSPVQIIDEYAFFDESDLTKVTLPGTLDSIGYAAFYNCLHLCEMNFPASLKRLGAIFMSYTNIQTVDLSACSQLATIGEWAFQSSNVSLLKFPSSLTSIGQYAFSWCPYLTDVNLSSLNNLKMVDRFAYWSCSTLNNITLPASVDSIGYGIALESPKLKEINVPVENLYYSSLDGDLYDKAESTFISYAAGKTDDTFVLPEHVATIGKYAFGYSNNLEAIITNETLNTIGSSAFASCENLNTVLLNGTTINGIGPSAFYGCTNLSLLQINTFTPPVIQGNNTFYGVDTLICELRVPAGSKEAYRTADGWSGFSTITDTVYQTTKTIYVETAGTLNSLLKEEEALYLRNLTLTGTINASDIYYMDNYLYALATLDISGVTIAACTIDGSSYVKSKAALKKEKSRLFKNKDKSSLHKEDSSMDVGQVARSSAYSVTYAANEIPYDAFWYRQSLVSVKFPETLTSIDDWAFGCTNLAEITFPETLTHIGDFCFVEVPVTSVTIPASLTSIGEAVFAASDNTEFSVNGNNPAYKVYEGVLYSKDGATLVAYPRGKTNTSYAVPSPVSTIAPYAFYDEDDLTSVELPSTLQKIGNDAFEDCEGFTSMTFPNMLHEIEEWAFAYSNLKSLDLSGTSVSKISYSSFEGTMISSLVLSQVVDTVESYAFYGCNELTRVNFTNYPAMKYMGDGVFMNCDNLSQLVLSGALESIGGYLVEGCSALTDIGISSTVTLIPTFASKDGNLYSANYQRFVLYAPGKEDTNFDVPASVTTIGKYAFIDTKLTSISTGENLQVIERGAFEDCYNLGTVTLNSPFLDSIGAYAFAWDYNLAMLQVNAVTPPAIYDEYVFLSSNTENCVLRVPSGSGTAYLNDSAWNVFSNMAEGLLLSSRTINLTSPGTLTSYMDYIDWNYLEELILTGTMDARDIFFIRDSLWALTSLDLSGATIVEYQGESSYYVSTSNQQSVYSGLSKKLNVDATRLKDAMIGLKSLGQKLKVPSTVVVYPANVIPEGAFYYKYGIKSIVLPDNVTSLGNYAFFGVGFDAFDIPASVTRIGDYCFCSTNLTTVHLPASVTEIGVSAFAWMFENELFTIDPSNPSYTVYEGSLYSKDRSTLVAYPAGSDVSTLTIPSPVTTIGSGAIAGNRAVEKITFPSTLQSIGIEAFCYCPALLKVDLTPCVNLTEIGDYAFSKSYSIEEVDLPVSLTLSGMGIALFNACSGLLRFVVPEGSTLSVVDGNLYNTDKTVLLYYAAGKPDAAFTVPESVVTINDYAFSSADKLISIKTGSKLDSIGYMAFANLSELRTVLLNSPDLTKIGEYAFYNAASLNVLQIKAAVPPALCDGVFENVPTASCFLIVPSGSMTTYQSASQWSYFSNIQEGFLSTSKSVLLTDPGTLSGQFDVAEQYVIDSLILTGNIDARDFLFIRDEMPALVHLDLSGACIASYSGYEGTSSIGRRLSPQAKQSQNRSKNKRTSTGVSEDCDENELIVNSLKTANSNYSVYYPANVIPEYAFFNYDNYEPASLTSIVLPVNLEGIDFEAFWYSEIRSMAFPNTLKYIGEWAFERSAMESFNLPDSLESIGWSAFFCNENNTGFTVSVNNPYFSSVDGVLFSKDKKELVAYPYAKEGTSYAIPSPVESIRECVFCYNENMTSFTYPSTLKYVGYSAFEETSITQLDLSGCPQLRYIDSWAFATTRATRIVLPASVDTITRYSFAYNDYLTTVDLSRCTSLKAIDNYAFGFNPKLTSLDLSPCTSLRHIGNYMMPGDSDLTRVTLPVSLSADGLGFGCFVNCTSLQEILVSEASPYLTTWNGDLYNKDKTALISYAPGKPKTVFIVPECVRIIDDYAFNAADNLTTIYTGFRVDSIRYRAFAFCDNLEQLIINGEYVAYMEYLAVGYNPLLSLLQINSYYPPEMEEGVFTSTDQYTCELNVPVDASSNYYKADQWSDFYYIYEYSATDLPSDISSTNLFLPTLVDEAFKPEGLTGEASLVLFNLSGQSVLTARLTGNESISLSELPDGVYIVRLTTSDGKQVMSKLVKQ